MSIAREPIYTALLTLLQQNVVDINGAPLVTYTRFLKHWADVPAQQQPYLCLTIGNETHGPYKTGLPRSVVLRPQVVIYVKTTGAADGGPSPATLMNAILDSLDNVVSNTNDPQNRQSLGGLVQRCEVRETRTSEGTLGDQEVATVSLELLVTG